jgi:hypothetical protein
MSRVKPVAAALAVPSPAPDVTEESDISRITAIHEAGHAIAAIRAGLVFDTVSAVPDESHELDGALYWDELQESGEIVAPPELLAVVLLAGPCAEARERRLRFDRIFSGVGATEDRESMATLGLSEDQFVAAVHQTADLVERDWKLIERVADELLVGARLTFEEVEDIVDASDS